MPNALTFFRVLSGAGFALASLAWLWFRLLDHLRFEWALNPQYSYGWAVPVLCAYLLWQRVSQTGPGRKPATFNLQPSTSHVFLFALLAVCYAPTRLIQVANPDWRLISWALAGIVIGLTLLLVESGLRRPDYRFPIAFFLIAIPWPTFAETTLVQGLTRANASLTVELMNLAGVPVLRHGSVIEVATGVVGIDEACSGIRSFQATLMIALFLGELYRLDLLRRVTLVLGGVALSFLFNVARTSLLVWVAANRGTEAIASWHDPAGVTILVGCFCGLWLLGVWFKHRHTRNSAAEKGDQPATENAEVSTNHPAARLGRFHWPKTPAIPLALCAWLVAVEVGVEWWYRSHESRLTRTADWTVNWPTNQPGFKDISFPQRTRQILRYDEGRNAAWQRDGVRWQAIFLRWDAGRTAPMLARNHTPEVCLPATGKQVKAAPDLIWLEAQGLRFPFRSYEVTDARSRLFVFYCLWSDLAREQGFSTASLTYRNRLRPVQQGLRNSGQRSLEIVVGGARDATHALALVRDELQRLLIVKAPTGS